ncbi:bacteriohopanetetrol glucosamine biosynthesis glycosyltransferase HpnI [Geomonas nitrogeniifigens]|uniref:Bacteriohopanetetrol glucosamine biosynthesis glycosyltransferase HpnI n=1 Tax=Geomonas diazotrophica TaxID=2843197 RepID=A0ABX8JKN3_9BACT|nr:bacteriohopanetetrol glucosamine biosynthesis glycosyltransferase HpnI [Geomonas nitrogeniifigens]QWV98308.1 bacteriohopanetetrol glucosamine biosynthesis glycosyltransferase HpnI [Geomonas nitrogeniifigens]QXE87492.1 bacteriohopanetetrol glucosamine biosynthesis glycosyltransferase HpnI [Geomonas nitrogeniifigens]
MLREALPFLAVTPSLAYAAITLHCGRSFFANPAALPDHAPPVSILKPVRGVDGDSFENFSSFCRQDYPRYQIVFAVASHEDPVLPIIERLMQAYPETDIELVVDPGIHGANYKVCNLMHAYAKAKHPLLVVCDSDIRVGEGYLRQVCAPFADPEVGLVTSLYRSSQVRGTGCAIEALGFCCEMIPNVMAALKLEGLSFALGASMAVRREALERIGGFEALVDYLADDYQLGNMIHRAGYRLELSPYFVESVMRGDEKLSELLSRQLRWGRTMRVSRPGGYLASGITLPFPGAVLALLLSGGGAAGWLAAALLYLVRSVVSTIYSRQLVQDRLLPRWLWLLPLRDALSFGVWGLSLIGNRVRWRGDLFRLEKGGKIVAMGGASD